MDKLLEKQGGMQTEVNDSGEMVFYISGELDHHSVKDIREEIDCELIDSRPKKVVLDLEGVTFTDSAGLGLILGRYTRIKEYGGNVRLTGVSDEFMKILRLAGTERLIRIESKSKK